MAINGKERMEFHSQFQLKEAGNNNTAFKKKTPFHSPTARHPKVRGRGGGRRCRQEQSQVNKNPCHAKRLKGNTRNFCMLSAGI